MWPRHQRPAPAQGDPPPATPVPAPDAVARLAQATAGRYAIEDEIGAGGMGIVVRAHDLALDRPVAIKMLRPELAARSIFRARFFLEARTAARLSHPNIVPIHHVEDLDDVVFFVMEYIDGETLARLVERAGPPPLDDVLRWLQDVAWALGYAHAHGVVHRDVKPDNILIDRATGRAMVTDFGIAHLVSSDPTTALGGVVGTACYMSPEQAGAESVDARSDIYSLGATAYYAVTGRPPFDAPTMQQILAMQQTRRPPSLAGARPDLPRSVAAIIERCLAKDPARRYESGELLAADLGNARANRVVLAPEIRKFLHAATAAGHRVTTVIPVTGIAVYAFAAMRGIDPLLVLWAAWVVAVELIVQPLGVFRAARRVRRAGIGHADFVRAVQESDYDRYQATPSNRFRRRVFLGLVAVAVAAVGAVGAAVASGAAGADPTGWHSLGVAGSLVAVGFLGAAGLSVWGAATGGVWLRQTVWTGRFGRWFFRLAGWRLEVESGAGADLTSLHSIHGILASLPADVRRKLRPLPRRVDEWEAERTQLEERLDAIADSLRRLDTLAPTPGDTQASDVARGLALHRESAEVELRAAQERAQSDLSAVVGRLERVHVDLLRLRAGVCTAEDVLQEGGIVSSE